MKAKSDYDTKRRKIKRINKHTELKEEYERKKNELADELHDCKIFDIKKQIVVVDNNLKQIKYSNNEKRKAIEQNQLY